MKIVIVGGVAGGATAAARLRRLDEKAQIVVLERTGYVSYANCGLPYYIGGVIEDQGELTLQTPESFRRRFNIDVRVKQEVTKINTDQKTVSVKDLRTGRDYDESYDKLILSPGARPSVPDLPGTDSRYLFTLRTVEDTLKIRQYALEHKEGTAVIIGGGFIGLEMAENLVELGMSVTVIGRSRQIMSNLDYDMAVLIHALLRKKGIRLILEGRVEGFEEEGQRVKVLLAGSMQKGAEQIPADMVILAAGVVPETALAKDAGLELGQKGSIVVNDRMETSVPDIYAVGDAVQVKHLVSGKDAVISLAGPANKQGRIAADNICGIDSHYKGSQGSFVIKLFQMTAAGTGLNEKSAKAAGFSYEKVILSPSSHAGYYPGAKVMTMKILFERGTGRILGAQIVGQEGVDKRIDVLAAAISLGACAGQLKDLDLSYAPPYSSAKDPVNMAGFMIDNLLSGRVKQFHWEQIPGLLKNRDVTLVDARTKVEYDRGHIEGFINIPVDDLRKKKGILDPSRPVYVMCQSGIRSYIACCILSGSGYDCYNFSGGWRFYEAVTKEKQLCEEAWPCGMDR